MPSIFTHAVAGLELATICFHDRPAWFWGLSALLGALPDFDALGFYVGVPYRSFLGHRGFTHSILFAVAIGLPLGAATAEALAVPGWLLGGYFTLVIIAHALLDALTDGGLGVALFSPFDRRRWFFPWRPIRVAPLGRHFFTRRGLAVLASEVRWVWLPLAAVAAIGWLWRWAR